MPVRLLFVAGALLEAFAQSAAWMIGARFILGLAEQIEEQVGAERRQAA